MLCPKVQAELFDLVQVTQGYVAAKGFQEIELFTRLAGRTLPTALKRIVLYTLDYGAMTYAAVTPKPARGLAT